MRGRERESQNLQVGPISDELETFLTIHFHAGLERLLQTKKREVSEVMKATSKEEWTKAMEESGLNKELTIILRETYQAAKQFGQKGLWYAAVSVFYRTVFDRLPGLVDYRWCGAKPIAPYDLTLRAASGTASREKVRLDQPAKPVVYEL